MLSDPDKRAAYDRYGHAGVGGQGGFNGGPFAGGVDIGDIFGDLFGEMFNVGGRRSAARGSSAATICASIWPSILKTRSSAPRQEVRIRRLETCATCNGRGTASGRGPKRVRSVPGARTAPLSAGILFCGAHLRRMRRQRAR